MIVMGANSIGRLERLVSSVTVEPVMTETETDILVVRERDDIRVPAARRRREKSTHRKGATYV
jgi:hypothetical protein